MREEGRRATQNTERLGHVTYTTIHSCYLYHGRANVSDIMSQCVLQLLGSGIDMRCL